MNDGESNAEALAKVPRDEKGAFPVTTNVPHTHPIYKRKPFCETSSGVRLCGVVSPPATDERSEDTPFITREDLPAMRQALYGVPLFDNHRVGEVLGRVMEVDIDDKQRLRVEVELEDTPSGYSAYNEVANGRRIGFSLGTVRRVIGNKFNVDKNIFELSITNDPEFAEDALIDGIKQYSHMHGDYKRVVCNMLRGDKLAREARAGGMVGTSSLFATLRTAFLITASHGRAF